VQPTVEIRTGEELHKGDCVLAFSTGGDRDALVTRAHVSFSLGERLIIKSIEHMEEATVVRFRGGDHEARYADGGLFAVIDRRKPIR
jgi:hypothetical protein